MARPGVSRDSAEGMRQRGWPTLEWALSLTVIAILLGLLGERLLNMGRLAEQASVQQTIGILRTAMYLEVARRAGSGDLRAVAAMDGENPVRWLAQPPDGYLGEMQRPDPAALPGGSWFYDAGRRELAYAPRRLLWQAGLLPADGVFRFRVSVGRAGGATERPAGIGGVELRPVAAYGWPGA